MPQSKVVMNVRKVSPTTSIIDIQGEVSAFAEDTLMEASAEASRRTTRAIILNFGGLEYMTSSGISLLVTGADVQPLEVIKQWKETFPKFWPRASRFYIPLTGIAPGEVAVINMLIPGNLPVGLPLSTGVLVLYADDESFTLMTPQGHTFAGWITFSSYKEDDCTVAQGQVLLRSYDPIYEIAFRFFGAGKAKGTFWTSTLTSLPAHLSLTSRPE